jgi:hypothetical protein
LKDLKSIAYNNFKTCANKIQSGALTKQLLNHHLADPFLSALAALGFGTFFLENDPLNEHSKPRLPPQAPSSKR